MQFDRLRRREFITLLGGAAAAWPLAARAQQPERMRSVGVFTAAFAADDQEGLARVGALLQGLQQLGWTIGRNLRIEYRWGGGDAERTRKYATELAALSPDVILTSGSATIGPLLQATRTVPVVFVKSLRMQALFNVLYPQMEFRRTDLFLHAACCTGLRRSN